MNFRNLASAMMFGLLLNPISSTAQVNEPGKIHVSIGGALGIHSINYLETFTYSSGEVRDSHSDGAITLTVPIQVHVGVVDILSLGVYFEPGNYVDFDGSQTNSLMMFGFQPRLYLVNSDRFAFNLDPQIGASFFSITDYDDNTISEAKYSGLNYGLGLGVEIYFSDMVGMHIRSKVVRNTFELKSYSQTVESTTFEYPLTNYTAELKSLGGQLQLGLSMRF